MTNSRELLQHTENLLKENESTRLGIDKNGILEKRDNSKPMVVDEEALLDKYLEKNQV
jgi:hypothetical protein